MEEMEEKKLKDVLEDFLKSSDFRQGVIASTKASFGGSFYYVELLPEGSWRILWKEQVGNRYQSPGMLLPHPTESEEDWFLNEETLFEGFFNEESLLAQELRESLSLRLGAM